MADEYIRKQDAFDAVEERITELMTHPEFRRKHLDIDLSGVIRNISAIKPADVAPVVHAHWIQTSAEDENGNAYYYCSNCGRGESHNPIVEVPYCWKCGAKMNAHGEEQ